MIDRDGRRTTHRPPALRHPLARAVPRPPRHTFGEVYERCSLIPDAARLERPPLWSNWSAAHLARAFDDGPVVINPLIYAELSVGFDRIEDLDDALPDRVVREDLPWDAGFLAGRCFLEYRRRGGARRSPLPDFYIAAHAAVTGRALLTRDRPHYFEVLPSLRLIVPE